MRLYYITDRRQFPGEERGKRERLLRAIEAAARCGIDYIQVREPDLPSRELHCLVRDAVQIVRLAHRSGADAEPMAPPRSRLLVNSRLDIALAAEADGVHLPALGLSPNDARAVWHLSKDLVAENNSRIKQGIFAVSCHTISEVRMAEAQGADFAVFAPVFEKWLDLAGPSRAAGSARQRCEGVGIEALRQACCSMAPAPNVEGAGSGRMPVLALGGVTLENTPACLRAGAAGIAGIRLFQENNVAETVARLRVIDAKVRSV